MGDAGAVGLFLGAGAAHDLGMPLVWELTPKAERERVTEALGALEARSRDETGRQLAARIVDLSSSGVLEGIDDPRPLARRLADERLPRSEKQLEAMLKELESRRN